jgi:hypothetical protein
MNTIAVIMLELLFLALNLFNLVYYEARMLPHAFAEYLINLVFIAVVANETFKKLKKEADKLI